MVQIKVQQGVLEGEERELVTGDGKVFSFKGIPYATPPVGNLRFKAPLPPQPWEGIRRALDHGPVCYQFDIFSNKKIEGSEDCLYLNVYSPKINPNKPAPVMVFIHGGGFKSGSGNSAEYGPDFLVQQEVVLVTLNYRLEVLGFLCLDSEEVPGNAGLKDQLAALKWVRENIAAFGGDPNNVTLFGESAGGASVGYHIISPRSKGLFHRAILMSGTPLCEWGYSTEPVRRAHCLARELGASKDVIADSKKLLAFFQSVPLNQLTDIQAAINARESMGNPTNSFFFAPVVEKNFCNNDPFLSIHVTDALKQGTFNDVDIMIGYTSAEASLLTPILASEAYINVFERYYEYLLPRDLVDKINTPIGVKLSDDVRKRYFGNEKITSDSIEQLVSLMSWRMFNYEILNFLNLFMMKSKSQKYVYKFSCESKRNMNWKLFGESPKVPGVSHLDDLLYIFDQPIHNLPLDKRSKSYKMIQQTTALWTNFAKTGNPTPDDSLGATWSPYTSEDQQFLDVGEQLTPGLNLDMDLFNFWKNIYALAN